MMFSVLSTSKPDLSPPRPKNLFTLILMLIVSLQLSNNAYFFFFSGDAAFYDVFGIENFNARFNTTETQGKFQLLESYFNTSNREETMKNFARLNVYIADSNVVKTQEDEDYTRNQLVSDIGGQLGLWVGISIITLAEVFELIIDIIRYMTSFSYKRVPLRSNATRRKPISDGHSMDGLTKRRRNNNEDISMSDYNKRKRLEHYNGFKQPVTAFKTQYGNGESLFRYDNHNDDR